MSSCSRRTSGAYQSASTRAIADGTGGRSVERLRDRSISACRDGVGLEPEELVGPGRLPLGVGGTALVLEQEQPLAREVAQEPLDLLRVPAPLHRLGDAVLAHADLARADLALDRARPHEEAEA